MPKDIKKFYNFMNLSFSSTVEEVQEREKVMIKILQAKAMKYNKNYQSEIDKVVNAANSIVEYINKNGIPNKKDNWFKTSKTSIFIQILMLVSVIVVLYMTIYSII